MAITVASHSGSTVANTVLDLSSSAWHTTIVVYNRSTQASPVEIWVRMDGVAPTVAGDSSYVVQAATSRSFPNLTTPPEPGIQYSGAPTSVQIISGSICPYEIEYL